MSNRLRLCAAWVQLDGGSYSQTQTGCAMHEHEGMYFMSALVVLLLFHIAS